MDTNMRWLFAGLGVLTEVSGTIVAEAVRMFFKLHKEIKPVSIHLNRDSDPVAAVEILNQTNIYTGAIVYSLSDIL